MRGVSPAQSEPNAGFALARTAGQWLKVRGHAPLAEASWRHISIWGANKIDRESGHREGGVSDVALFILCYNNHHGGVG